MQKLSRSKIELFTECPRCFWLDVKKGVKRPQPAPYTINSAIDYLLKQEFDEFRAKGEPHPIMKKNKIDAVPYQSPHLDKWRHNFTGVSHDHAPTSFHVYGAVDDIWVDPEGKLIVVDYKSTGANQHRIYDSYQRQMEVYQWLLRQNGYDVSPRGYFVFARVDKGKGFGNGGSSGSAEASGALPFHIFVEGIEGDDSWVPDALRAARETFDLESSPEPSDECEYCNYRRAAAEF